MCDFSLEALSGGGRGSLWLAANAIALVPLVVVFGRFERQRATEGAPAPAWRYVLGALITVVGFALLAAQGVRGYGRFGLNVWGIVLALAGIGLVANRIGASRPSYLTERRYFLSLGSNEYFEHSPTGNFVFPRFTNTYSTKSVFRPVLGVP